MYQSLYKRAKYAGSAAIYLCGKAEQSKADIALTITSCSDRIDGVHAENFTLSELAIMTS